MGFPGGASGNLHPPTNAREAGSYPGSGRSPGGGHGHPYKNTPVFLPRESHGQRSLVGYSPWGHKEVDMTEVTYTQSVTYMWIAFLDFELNYKEDRHQRTFGF